MRASLLAIVMVVPLVCGCALVRTPYKPQRGGWGYSEWPLGRDMFAVQFEGNMELDMHEFRMNLLRRAAELTLGHGFGYFTIMETNHHPRPSIMKDRDLLTRQEVYVFRQTITIRCHQEDPGLGFNAAKVLVTLVPQTSETPVDAIQLFYR